MIAKVCGLTTPEDVALVLAAGAGLLGFLSHPASARHCPDRRLPALAGDRAVLVMVAEDAGEVAGWAAECGASWVQPYLPDRSGLALLRARGLRILLPWPDEPGQEPADADLYLWETGPKATGLLGGSGVGHGMAHPPPGPFLLAGGLDGNGLGARYAALPRGLDCRGFDAASRLESTPGRKDAARVDAFVRAAQVLGGRHGQ
jgi:phosphoribosylanthranilate isomerase